MMENRKDTFSLFSNVSKYATITHLLYLSVKPFMKLTLDLVPAKQFSPQDLSPCHLEKTGLTNSKPVSVRTRSSPQDFVVPEFVPYV